MKKTVLIILIIATCLKIVCESSAFTNKYSIIKIAAHEEESKNKEEENKHGKRYYEDISYTLAELRSTAYRIPILSLSVIPQKPYIGFIDKPNTPPPNLT